MHGKSHIQSILTIQVLSIYLRHSETIFVSKQGRFLQPNKTVQYRV